MKGFTKKTIHSMGMILFTLVLVLPIKSGRELIFTGGRPTSSQREPVEFIVSLQNKLNGGAEWRVEYLFETGFKTVAEGEFQEGCLTDQRPKENAPWWLGGLVFGYHRAESGEMCETLQETLKGLRDLGDGGYLDGGRSLPNWGERLRGGKIFGIELSPWVGGGERTQNRTAEIFEIEKTTTGVILNITKGGVLYQKINLMWSSS